eukprot:CAMPEP_0206276082 /NCGR_PEP_ID=MMETSP0047_2-20121206/36108_1 /ASSEMBLY_ACC=CAM_ASM_000192 /TAXON_ID=195065 /ORGANISM="Chroomonas mesostigmatica_cf, Strain CCMP1168" /LENGTH=79 /DNA_ID=CAMNT_0053705559 /DNA_START=458 /DNA_END=693 /DNA_ORIENTATION=+
MAVLLGLASLLKGGGGAEGEVEWVRAGTWGEKRAAQRNYPCLGLRAQDPATHGGDRRIREPRKGTAVRAQALLERRSPL